MSALFKFSCTIKGGCVSVCNAYSKLMAIIQCVDPGIWLQ